MFLIDIFYFVNTSFLIWFVVESYKFRISIYFQCPDKPNVTNNIVCSSCGAAGHIARDCRSKRPGQGGPPLPGDKAKIDEEYMSLMAELGEAPPPELQAAQNTTPTTQRKTTGVYQLVMPNFIVVRCYLQHHLAIVAL